MPDDKTIQRLTSIPGLRADVAERVAAVYPDAAQLSEATQDDLTEIKGVGAVTAARIVDEFAGDAVVRRASEPATEAARPAAEPARLTEFEKVRRDAERAQTPVDTIKVAVQVVAAGTFAVVGTVREQLPEVKHHVGRAAGAVLQLGRELGRTILRRAS